MRAAASAATRYVFDTHLGTLPDTMVDTFGTTTTSASLPTGSNKYFHIRTRDAGRQLERNGGASLARTGST